MTSFAISESARTAADNSDDTYVLVTDTKYLLNDHEIILFGNNAEAYSAMGYQRSTNNRYAVLLSDQNVSDGITIAQSDISNGLQKITLKKSDELYSFYVTSTGHASESGTTTGYLYSASESKNYLETQASLDDNGRFTITKEENDEYYRFLSQGTNSRNFMRYNSSSTLFSCYPSDNTSQKTVFIYKNTKDILVLFEGNGGNLSVTSSNLTGGKLLDQMILLKMDIDLLVGH